MTHLESLVYSSYFTSDRELSANITLPDRRVIQQRCIINSIIDELADIGFAGEELPEWNLITIGTPFELRGHDDHGAFGCRAVVVDINVIGHYLVRLVGSVYLGELRDFQRLDVFLPCRYHSCGVSSIDQLTELWLSTSPENTGSGWRQRDPNAWMDPSDETNEDDSIPFLALASREQCIIETPLRCEPDTFVDMTLFIPTEQPRIVRTIGRVARIDPFARYESGKQTFKLTVVYALIRPDDRDAIDDYVSGLQVLHSAEVCKDAQYEALYNRLKKESSYRDPLLWVKRLFAGAIITILLILLVRYLDDYRKGHEKGFIERTFEEGLKKYMEKFK